MPHHWRPKDTDEPAQEEKTSHYEGTDEDGVTWELVQITEDDAKKLKKKPKKHDCERILRP
jgi:hypothetical protein